MSCKGSLVCWVLHRAAWQGLNKSQSSKRMTGRGPCRPAHPGSPFVAWLLLEKAQQVATGRRGGWSPASPPELQSSCLVLHFCAAALPRARTSCSVSGKQRDRSFNKSDVKATALRMVSVGGKMVLRNNMTQCLPFTLHLWKQIWTEPHSLIVTDWIRFGYF